MAKKIISESMLRAIISEEVVRFKKRLTLEAEKKKILKRLHEIRQEEIQLEEDIDENLLKKLGGVAKSAGNAAKTLFASDKAAADTAAEWISNQSKDLVDKAKAQDEATYRTLLNKFQNYLRRDLEIGGKYMGLYLEPFFGHFGELGQKDAKSRNLKFIANSPLKTGSNAE
jgi:DNA polymerase III delta prime subunit